ncbi:MAG: DUF371 domain-containing protein [Candidatus Aenigmarchaeota archaeon]|nr:DUF371 domain-containing protein [Candidatus Aenigmarchaeota archaeon]MBU5688787.1 DUF371 domain-containing protein [Candidatus Aenigmarchaeota archaeon]
MILEEIIAYGHPLVLAKHKSTIEITKEVFLTKKGDCIIAVNASKSCFDLNEKTKRILKEGKKIKFVFEANGIKDELIAFGDKNLLLESTVSFVIRKSDFIDERTIAVKANKAAFELKRELIKELKNPNTKLIIRLIV